MTSQFKFGEKNKVYSGYLNIDSATATGTQAITGVGFTPQVIIIFGGNAGVGVGSASWGLDDGTSHVIYDQHQIAANTYKVSTSIAIYDVHSSGNTYTGIINSFDSDGFTIGWTKTGSPTGTLRYEYIAYA